MNKEEEYGKYIAEVKGIGKEVEFKLREKEVKHIRRCLRNYDLVHSRDYPNQKDEEDLTKRIHGKFSVFGRLKSPLSTEQKRRIVPQLGNKCSFEGCKEKDNLTVAHIRPLASGVNNNSIKNLKLLCVKHHLLSDLKDILWRKGLEVEKLKKRIKDIEQKNTTDTLGMGVLSENKFTDIDADEIQ